MKEKYYVLITGEDGPELHVFDSPRNIQDLMDEIEDKPEVRTDIKGEGIDLNTWEHLMLVIKGEIVKPKTRQITEQYWEAE